MTANNNPNKYHNMHCCICNAHIIADDRDVYYSANGQSYINCPVCGHRVEGLHKMPLNTDNIMYPNHFEFHNELSPDALMIEKHIKNILHHMRNNPNLNFTHSLVGDSLIMVTRKHNSLVEDEFYVVVTNTYQEAILSAEN